MAGLAICSAYVLTHGKASMNIRNIIFDWDGTLAMTLDIWLRGYDLSFRQRGHSFDSNFIVNEFFHNHHEVPVKFPELDFPNVAEETRSYVLDGLSDVQLYEGVLETLVSLKNKGTKLTLVTSSARPLLSRALGAHNLEHSFDSIIAGDDGFGHKPNTLPFNTTLERIKADPTETLVIGDSSVDIQAGRLSGCQTCWFAPEHNSLFHDFDLIRSMSPDYEISEISKLMNLL